MKVLKFVKKVLGCFVIFAATFCITKVFAQTEKPIDNPSNFAANSTAINLLINKANQLSAVKGKNDSVLIYYNQALQRSRQMADIGLTNQLLIKLSLVYAAAGDSVNCRQAYQQIRVVSDGKTYLLKSRKNLVDLLSILADIKDPTNIIRNEKIYVRQKKRAVNLLLKDTVEATNDLKELGDEYLNIGKLDKAEIALQEVVKIYKLKHYKEIHNVYYLLAAVNHLKGDLQKELFNYTEAVKGMEAVRDTGVAPWFYYKLAHIYKVLNQYDKSLFYFQKSISELKARKLSPAGAVLQVVEIEIAQGRPGAALKYFEAESKLLPRDYYYKYTINQGFADCYVALKQYSEAEKYLLGMIDNMLPFYATTSQTNDMHIRDYEQVADFYIRTKNYAKAKYFLQKADILSKENVSALSLSELELMIFRVDSAFGNYVSGIKHYQTHIRIKDSIFNSTKSKQIADLQIHYQIAEKDRNIQKLENQSIIEQQRLQKRKMFGNLLIAGLILLTAILGFLYNRSITRKRNIKLLETAQREVSAKNLALEKLLRDNEWLLKEVHHRVKNNLHLVMSLLQSQTVYLKDEGALNAVLDSQHRVQAMSLIHQKLYKSKDASSVYMPEYINELVDYLKESFKTGLRIYFKLEISPIILDVMQAVPVGLILNEIITNSIKYAFPFSDEDEVQIKLEALEEDQICLMVSDNGRGLPDKFDLDKTESFGLLLIRGLIEDLGGTFILQNNQGTKFTLTFIAHQYDQLSDKPIQ